MSEAIIERHVFEFPRGEKVVRIVYRPRCRDIGYDADGNVLRLCRGACKQWRREREFHPLNNPGSDCKLNSECRYCCNERRRIRRIGSRQMEACTS